MALDDFIQQVGIVSRSTNVDFSEVRKVAAALDKQVQRDLRKFWKTLATVQPFESLDDVPVGTWPVIVLDDVKNAAGVHEDVHGQPFAVCEAGIDWSQTASHETLEMLVDPWGNRLVPGPSLKPDQGRVEYLVEVCDPSEDLQFSYKIGTDNVAGEESEAVVVSDFYTPEFFDPVQATGTRYSFTGAISRPRQILRGGYISWRDPVSDDWWQQTWFGGESPTFRSIGKLERDRGESLRRAIQKKTPEQQKAMRRPYATTRSPTVPTTARPETRTRAMGKKRAERWHSRLKDLGVG
jgi:hypothetical protein